MSESIQTINKIQNEWYYLVSAYINKEEREILLSKHSIDLMGTILNWLTKSNIIIPSRNSTITNFEYRLNTLISEIRKFWESNSESLIKALNDLEPYALEVPLYMVQFSGSSIIRRLGIYFDTVYVSDPLHLNDEDYNTLIYFSGKSLDRRVRFVQNLAQVLQLNPIRSQNIDHPLFVIIPDLSSGYPERDMLNTGNFIFEKLLNIGSQYSNADEFLYALKKGEIDLTEKNINRKNLDTLLPIFGYNKSGTSYMWRQTANGYEVVPYSTHSEGSSTFKWLFSKIYDSFDAYSRSLTNAMTFSIDPIVPYQYWQIYEWLCANIAPGGSIFSPNRIEELAITQGLLKDELKFVEAISIDDLRIIREEGNFNDLRASLRMDRVELKKATPDSINDLSTNFASNLIEKVILFGEEMKKNEKDFKKKRIMQFTSLAGSTGVALVPFAFPTAALVAILSSTVGILFGGRSILDIIKSYRDTKRNKEFQICSPLGILFSAYEKEK
jgi:hypothetical protein